MIKRYLKQKKSKRMRDPFAIQTGRIRDSVMNTAYRDGWAEEAFISDSLERETVGNSFNGSKIPLIGAALAIFIFVLLGKTAWLQIVKADYYYQVAEGNRIRIQRIEPKRGIIYDSQGRVLARNMPNFMLYFVPADLPVDEGELEKITGAISTVLPEVTKEAMNELLSKVDRKSLEAYQPLFVVDNIEYENAMKLYLDSDNWPGVILTNKSRREYPVYGLASEAPEYYLSLSHILGYTGKINQKELDSYGDEYLPIDYIGKMGIEYFWENELKGKSGKKQVEVDALGKEKKLIGEIGEEDGNNLVLSLDVMQQIKLEEILAEHLGNLGASRASAILTDPDTGEIKAMVSLPSYDNNVFARGISQDEYSALVSHPDKPLFNRSISGEYPSGSTIKPVMSAAALEEKIITEHTSFISSGGIRIGQWFFPDWRAGGHGVTDVRKAIADSVNTFFYYIGGGHEDFKGLGVDRIVEYGRLFGLGKQTGIDLAGEASGFLPTKEWKEEAKNEAWYIGDTYHLAIGQGDLLVTPLQVAVFTGFFANKGSLYRPHFVSHVLSADEKRSVKIPIEPVKDNFIDSYNLEVVRQGMRQTVTKGSARLMAGLPVEAAGKTGTAQWSSKKKNHAWFTGFAPYEEPELVITVLIEEGGEGSDAAVPIANDYLRWYFGEYKKNEQ